MWRALQASGVWTELDFPKYSKAEMKRFGLSLKSCGELKTGLLGTEVEEPNFTKEELRAAGHSTWKAYLLDCKVHLY